uniref:DNA-directed DNA polymerase n=1 Tax=Panagrellus redivivus TaxID=6233 RepID=A0A7E4V909_PANRE
METATQIDGFVVKDRKCGPNFPKLDGTPVDLAAIDVELTAIEAEKKEFPQGKRWRARMKQTDDLGHPTLASMDVHSSRAYSKCCDILARCNGTTIPSSWEKATIPAEGVLLLAHEMAEKALCVRPGILKMCFGGRKPKMSKKVDVVSSGMSEVRNPSGQSSPEYTLAFLTCSV